MTSACTQLADSVRSFTCLTLMQPWATLVAYGFKEIENRTWYTNHRGPLLITSSALPASQVDSEAARETMARTFAPSDWERWNTMEEQARAAGVEHEPHGCLVALVDLVDVVQDSDSIWALPEHYHWKLAYPRIVDPVPVSGRQGLWRWTGNLGVPLGSPAWVEQGWLLS